MPLLSLQPGVKQRPVVLVPLGMCVWVVVGTVYPLTPGRISVVPARGAVKQPLKERVEVVFLVCHLGIFLFSTCWVSWGLWGPEVLSVFDCLRICSLPFGEPDHSYLFLHHLCRA